MNSVDLALAFLLAIGALRGYWRGFLRETFGLLAVVAAVSAALQYSAWGANVVLHYVRLPPPLPAGVAFVGLFVVVHAVVNGTGFIIDRLASAALRPSVNALGGAAVGVGKAAAVLAFILLFLHLFPLVSSLDGPIMASRIGRPLVSVASNVIRTGRQEPPQPDSTHTT
jgi:membrane protein required for colicin V production